MYGLNGVALIVFAMIHVLAVQLCKCDEAVRTKAILTLSLMLLLFNLVRYTLSPLLGHGVKIPVEFSTVAYFAMPTILLTGRKTYQSWAVYSGMMAGFFYYMAMVVAGGPLYKTYPPYDIYISMYCHGTLYLCGLVTIGTRQYSPNDGFKLASGIAYVAIQALLLRPLAEGSERIFIYELMDGDYIKQFLPQSTWPVALPVYYIVILCLVLLTIKGFFWLNSSRYQKFALSQEKRVMPIPAL